MTETFDNLDPAKQQQIINAALKEFAEKGFNQASTNTIVKHAGIGKGMLFYYFKSKKGLYLYLLDYAIRTVNDEYINRIDRLEPDFIERLKQIAQIKMHFYHTHPNVSNFISSAYLNEPFELPEQLKTRLAEFEQISYEMKYSHVDQTLFRKDIDVEKAFQLIRWSLEGYQHDLLKQFEHKNIASIDLDPYWKDFYDYIEILKTCFYNLKEDEK